MTTELRKIQAQHFDHHTPFIPGSRTLRATGFTYSYILKDEVIAQAIHRLPPAAGARLLDIGCGHGVFLDRMAAHYQTQGFGVDVSTASLRGARSGSLHPQRIAVSEGENLPFPEGVFDMAACFDVLEHVEAPERVLGEMVRVLKPGGAFLTYAVSGRNALTFNWFLTKALDAVHVDHWSRAGHAPDRLVDPERTVAYLEGQGCRIVQYQPFHSFFTILFDQSLLVMYKVAALIGSQGERSRSENPLTDRILAPISGIVRRLANPLRFLDGAWGRRGLSNGFLLAGTKPHHAATAARSAAQAKRASLEVLR